MAPCYEIPIEMWFSGLDIYGHVNSVGYFDYLETARVRLMSGLYRELTDMGIRLPVARTECDYKLPILFGDTVVAVTIPRIGGSSFDLAYRIHDRAGKTFAAAKTVMVCYDSVKSATMPVPDMLRKMAAGGGKGP